MQYTDEALSTLISGALGTGNITGGTTISGGITPAIVPVSTHMGQINAHSTGVPPIAYHKLSPLQVRQRVSPY